MTISSFRTEPSLPTAAQTIARLRSVNLADRRIDRAAIEVALLRHLDVGRVAPRPFRWCDTPAEVKEVLRVDFGGGDWFGAYDSASKGTRTDTAAGYDAALRAWEDGMTAGQRAVQRDCLHDLFYDPSGDALTDVLAGVARAVAALAAYEVRPRPCQRQLADLMLPFVDAFEAGLSRVWVTASYMLCMEAPFRLRSEETARGGQRFHCADGPAVAWRNGEAFWYWHGLSVPRHVVEAPETITAEEIDAEPNAEVRRVMIERVGGIDVYLPRSGAVLVAEDETGRLWRKQYPSPIDDYSEDGRWDGNVLTVVEVVNGTREPDGTYKTYFLRVPARMATAREAVAWTYGLTPEQYGDVLRT